MKNFYILFLVVIITFLQFSCKSPTAPKSYRLSLSVSDISCTEAWIKLTVNNAPLPTNVVIKRNGNSIFSFNLTSSDTTVYDSTLFPNQTYIYQATYGKAYPTETSQTVTAKTMDTTSNNFSFQTFTFGASNAGSSYLNDIAIINDNDIWAVGAVYLDSADGAPDPNAYNAVQWDGSKWNLKRIFYYGNCSAVKYPPLRSIYIFSDNSIVVTNGGSVGWVNDDSVKLDCRVNPLLTGAINKIWGTSSNDFYVVGNGGSIAHYQNGLWQQIESGTNLQFLDIYGVADPATGKQQILAVCSQNYPPGNGVFSIQGNTATEISSNFNSPGYPVLPELFSVWFVPNTRYYIAGDGIFEKHSLSDSQWNNGPHDITRYGTASIRGTGLNDIFVAGSFGDFLHFNGVRWQSFTDKTSLPNGSYSRVAIKGNLIIAVGVNDARAVITMIKRQ